MSALNMIQSSVLLLAALCSCSPQSGAQTFAGTTKIELSKRVDPEGPVRTVAVDQPSQVKQFIDAIRLSEKRPCGCAHLESARFHKSDGEIIQVSLCEHCFDVQRKGQTETYEMAPAFLNLFEAQFKESNSLIGDKKISLAILVAKDEKFTLSNEGTAKVEALFRDIEKGKAEGRDPYKDLEYTPPHFFMLWFENHADPIPPWDLRLAYYERGSVRLSGPKYSNTKFFHVDQALQKRMEEAIQLR